MHRYLLLLLLTSCGGGGGSGGGDDGGGGSPPPEPPAPVVDIDADLNRNGVVEDGETGDYAVFYWNIDDDDDNNAVDSGDDLASVVVRRFPPAQSVTVSVSASAQGRVKIFRAGNLVYSSGASFMIDAADVQAGDVELGIEAINRIQPAWNGYVTLTLDIDGVTDAVTLRCAPYLMATNLWPVEQLHVVNVGSNNQAFRTALQEVAGLAGCQYVEVPGGSYQNDRWLQDSSEPGVVYLPGTPRKRVDSVLQTARWRPVDQWCKNALWGPDFDFLERFSTSTTSLNYGGNIECVPPHAGHPWGRVLIGGGTSSPIGGGTPITREQTQVYRDFWDALAIQGPHLKISTEWLAVGHVDEIVSFVPAPATTRGWVVAIASPDVAKQILQTVKNNGGGAKKVFAGRSGWETTVDAILADAALLTYNQEVQVRLDAIREVLQTNVGLADGEFVHLPVLFEDSGNGALAYNPGVVNLMPLPTPTGIHLIIPDPEGPDDPTDAWQADIVAKLAPLGTGAQPIVIKFVNVFFSYHTLSGEAHCGLNAVRTPPDMDWWNP